VGQRRVSAALGLSRAEARLLLARARARLGTVQLAPRVVSFSLATAPGLRRAMPRAMRVRAIRPLVYALMPGPSANLLYANPGAVSKEGEHGG
jgi:hypothetical protein